MQSDNKNEIKELMNGFDTEFIDTEELKVTDNPDNESVLTPEGNVHVVDEETTHTKELRQIKRGKSQKKTLKSRGNALFSAFLRVGFPFIWRKCFSFQYL